MFSSETVFGSCHLLFEHPPSGSLKQLGAPVKRAGYQFDSENKNYLCGPVCLINLLAQFVPKLHDSTHALEALSYLVRVLAPSKQLDIETGGTFPSDMAHLLRPFAKRYDRQALISHWGLSPFGGGKRQITLENLLKTNAPDHAAIIGVIRWEPGVHRSFLTRAGWHYLVLEKVFVREGRIFGKVNDSGYGRSTIEFVPETNGTVLEKSFRVRFEKPVTWNETHSKNEFPHHLLINFLLVQIE